MLKISLKLKNDNQFQTIYQYVINSSIKFQFVDLNPFNFLEMQVKLLLGSNNF